MKEYRGVWPYRVTIDEECVLLKAPFVNKKHPFWDIHSVKWREPTKLTRGSIKITTGITEKYITTEFVFKNSDRDDFFELHSLLLDHIAQSRPERKKRQQGRKARRQQMDEQGTPYCPKCLSTELARKTYHIRGVIPIVRIYCRKCGYSFLPGQRW